jgi:predicted transport protein
MPGAKLVVPKLISLKERADLSERWVEDQLVENSTLLGLGEVEVRGKQRNQPKAGRLDLLLEDTENKKRFEVELQLGKSDESHIIRAIEYWDFERKRYPQYDHCAVLVAEDITSRFLNVIHIFNGIIPIVAIQLQAYEVGEGVALTFTKVIDELQLGEDDSNVIIKGVTTRKDYEGRVPKQILDLVDALHTFLTKLDHEYELRYTKYYIGLERAGVVNNFIQFRPKQHFLKLTFNCDASPELEKAMDDAGLDVMGYDQKWHEYTVRVTPKDFQQHGSLLADLIKRAYDYVNAQ